MRRTFGEPETVDNKSKIRESPEQVEGKQTPV